MADLITIAGLVLFGNYLNRSGLKSRQLKSVTENVPLEDLPSDQNIYHSERSRQVDQEVRKEATRNFLAANDPCNTGIIPAFYNTLYNKGCGPFQGMDLSETLLPQEVGAEPTTELDKRIIAGPMFKNPIPEGFSGVPQGLSEENVSELTGLPRDNTHNNMVPFFGPNIMQNLDDSRNEALLETFTGRGPTIERNKLETTPFFELQKENIFGVPNLPDELRKERYHQSNKKNNILPTPQIRTFAPKVEEMPRPKYYSIDELRAKSNPQISFQGRASGAPQGTTQRGQVAAVYKKKAPKYHDYGSSRFLPATTTVDAHRMPEDYSTNLKHTNRHHGEEYFIGPGTAVDSQAMKPGICRPSPSVASLHNLRPEPNNVGPRVSFKDESFNGFDIDAF